MDDIHYTTEYNLSILEISDIISILESYVPSVQPIKLEKFKSIDLNIQTVNKYKEKYKSLIHIRLNNNVNGLIFVDSDDNIVAFIAIEKQQDDIFFIIALEVSPKFRRCGYGTELLNIAHKKFGANMLSVNKKNLSAIKLYKSTGWKIVRDSECMLFMSHS